MLRTTVGYYNTPGFIDNNSLLIQPGISDPQPGRSPTAAGSSLGTLALTAGAFDDAAAWCILAIVLASFGGSWGSAYVAIGGGIAFALFMIFVGSKLLRRLGMTRLQPRPYHPKADPAAQEAYKKTSQAW